MPSQLSESLEQATNHNTSYIWSIKVKRSIMRRKITGLRQTCETTPSWNTINNICFSYFCAFLSSQVYRKERQQIKSSALEAARKADKKLTFVPLVLLFLRFWGMLRFYIYLTSSVDESESTRKFKKILLYFQVLD